jgi:hypothetical protein
VNARDVSAVDSRLTPAVRDELRHVEAEFVASGGRGVELAERLDALRARADLSTQAANRTGTIDLGVFGIRLDLDPPDPDAPSAHLGGTITSDLGPGFDPLELLILAHAVAGVEITSPAYLEGIETAVDAVANHDPLDAGSDDMNAMDEIARILRDPTRNAGTLDVIADVVAGTGRDLDGAPRQVRP